MASIQKVTVGGRTYWRIVESRRVNGRPRAIPVLHLGTANALLARLRDAPADGLRIRTFRHGDLAALMAVARRLGISSLIDTRVPHRTLDLSVGKTFLLAALHRALQGGHRHSWSTWASESSVRRFFPELDPEVLSPRFFWDQMDFLEPEVLQTVETDLARRVIDTFELTTDTLLFDRTNFFSYLAPPRRTSRRGGRGHSRRSTESRREAFGGEPRVLTHALLVSRRGRIPLFSSLYDGTLEEREATADLTERMRDRLLTLDRGIEDLTLVYGLGNPAWQRHVQDESPPTDYVAAHVPHATRIPVGAPAGIYRNLLDWPHDETTVVRLDAERLRRLHGRHSPRSRTGDVPELVEAWNAEEQLAHRMKALLPDRGTSTGDGFLITNRTDWSDDEVLEAFQGHRDVERSFLRMWDSRSMVLRPDYHWTERKLRLHSFLCLVSHLLERALVHEAAPLGPHADADDILGPLGQVRLAMVCWRPSKRERLLRCRWQLEETRPASLDLFRRLVPQQAPFVCGENETDVIPLPEEGETPAHGGEGSRSDTPGRRASPATSNGGTPAGSPSGNGSSGNGSSNGNGRTAGRNGNGKGEGRSSAEGEGRGAPRPRRTSSRRRSRGATGSRRRTERPTRPHRGDHEDRTRAARRDSGDPEPEV